MSARDSQVVLALDTLAVVAAGGYIDGAAADGQTARVGVAVAVLRLHTGLDALGRRIVVAAHVVGIARVVRVLRRTVIIIESAAGYYGDGAVRNGHHAVALHALAT